MSGIEIAAIVLKTFPILLQGANALFPIFQGTRDWFTFEQTYHNFISDIRTESIFYKQSLRIFLTPLQLHLEENGSMHQNANAPLWYDPTIRNKIKLRIQEENFDWFLDQLRTIDRTLHDLYNLLPKQGEKLRALDIGTIEYEMNRLKISFSIDRQPLMDTLKSTNSNLNRFVSNETLIEHSPTSKNIKIYQKLQKQAKSVYNGLHARLTCTAPPHSHQCAVMVDWSEYPNSLHSPSLKLLVGDPSNRKQLRCSVEMDSTPEVVVSEQATSWDSYDVQLRSREWRGKLVEAAKSHSVGIATVSAMATMLDPKNPHIEKIWQERENRKLKSKKASQLHAPKVKSSHRLSISGLARKSKKTSSAVDQPPSTSNGAGTTIPAAGSVSESGKDTDTQPASLPAKKPVRFNEADSPPPTNNVDREDSILIADVCAFLANRNLQPTREHLKHEQARLHFELDPPDQTMLQTATMTDLKTIFTTLPRLPDRLRLGIKLIRTFLSFGTSGWIPQDWDRHNVRILGPHAAAQGPLHPYISHAAFCKAAPLALTEDQTRSFFFGLGVILLELADSKTLEQTEVWKKVSTTDLQPAWLLMCAAGDWYEQLKCRHDETLSEPIRRCLKYGFANRANLDDGAFLAEVADGVLKPLESFVSRWGIAPR